MKMFDFTLFLHMSFFSFSLIFLLHFIPFISQYGVASSPCSCSHCHCLSPYCLLRWHADSVVLTLPPTSYGWIAFGLGSLDYILLLVTQPVDITNCVLRVHVQVGSFPGTTTSPSGSGRWVLPILCSWAFCVYVFVDHVASMQDNAISNHLHNLLELTALQDGV